MQNENLVFPYAEYFVAPRDRFICCAIPKNGCSLLKSWFLSVVEPEATNVADVHWHCREHHTLYTRGDEWWQTLQDFYCFTFLRDPYKRIASAFTNKFIEGVMYGVFEAAGEVMEDVARMKNLPVVIDTNRHINLISREEDVPASSIVEYSRGITFREFVHYLAEASDDHLDIHWRPQATFLAGHRFDFIGRLNALSVALPQLALHLGVRGPELPEHQTIADQPYQNEMFTDVHSGELAQANLMPGADALYNDELRELVRHRFAADFDLYENVATSSLPQHPTQIPAPVFP